MEADKSVGNEESAKGADFAIERGPEKEYTIVEGAI